jgi:hypothetical protein
VGEAAEEYIARVPAIAIVPWFLGRLALSDQRPARLPGRFAKFLPLTPGLALVRYGLLGTAAGSTASGAFTAPAKRDT